MKINSKSSIDDPKDKHPEISPDVYQVKVQGRLKPEWSLWFNGMQLGVELGDNEQFTILTGSVVDQSALRGIITRLWNLNLKIVSVILLDDL